MQAQLPTFLTKPLSVSGVLPLGLGCSRLGSINGASEDESIRLLSTALDGGIRFFDTSNIYGQGDSERVLGKVLGRRTDCLICSKAGKHLSLSSRLMLPFKQLLRSTVRHSSQASRGVASARSKPMPTCWDGAYLIESLDASLHRLNRDHIEIFMLHSPPAEVILRGDAIEALDRARLAGKVGLIGVSVDDVETAVAALKDSRIQALQIPLHPEDNRYNKVIADAACMGVAVIAREIFGGAASISQRPDAVDFAYQRVINLAKSPDILVPLVGTIKKNHLLHSMDAAKSVLHSAKVM